MKASTTVGEILAKHRERLGEQVSIEEIFELHDAAEGTEALSNEERIEILDRVAADPEAARKLKSLLRFPKDSPSAQDEGVEERWVRFKAQRLQVRAKDLEEELPPPELPPGTFTWQQFAGLAAALLLCTSLGFWAGKSVQRDGISLNPAVQLNTFVVELSKSGLLSRGGKQITWPSTAEGMLLAISAPEIEAPGPFDLVLLDTSGKTLIERSGLKPDRAGLCFVTVSRHLLPSGAYVVQLRNDRQQILSSFELEIS